MRKNIRRRCRRELISFWNKGIGAIAAAAELSVAVSAIARRVVAVLGTGTGELNAPANFTCVPRDIVLSSRSRANATVLLDRHVEIANQLY